MTKLVNYSQQENFSGKPTTTSLIVAEAFDKRHSDVLRDIRVLLDRTEMGIRNFALIEDQTVTHSPAVKNVHYEMTEEGFTLLVMGYNGLKALAIKERYIKEFTGMRELLNSDEYILLRSRQIMENQLMQAQSKIAELAEKNEDLSLQNQLQQTTIISQAPVVEYATQVLSAKNTWTITTIAKELGMSAKKLNKILELKKIQYKADQHFVLYSKYQDCNYTKTRTHTYTDSLGQTCTNMQTVWTELGRQFIHNLMKESAQVKVSVIE